MSSDLRKNQPEAFAAAGSPSASPLFQPSVLAPYLAFIILRKYRHFLVKGTRLWLIADVLYVLHILIIGLGIVAVAVGLAMHASSGGPSA